MIIKSKNIEIKKREQELKKFYDGFRDGIREVRAAKEGKVNLQTLEDWLKEINSK